MGHKMQVTGSSIWPKSYVAHNSVDVWQDSLHEAFAEIRRVVKDYPFVAMDTEFPGVVARPIGHFKSSTDYAYQTLRCNVDLLRLIQIGLSFCDDQGNTPEPISTWQFNFKFSIHEDMYATESIELLNKAGINFKQHEEQGIDAEEFAELLISSGLVLLDELLHRGYDFGYLIKVVSASSLPATEREFSELLKIWFPCIYDIKYLMRDCKSLKGGLQEVADDLKVTRHGTQHQAGSDSLLTAATFFKMRTRFFEDSIDDARYLGHLYGYNCGTSAPNSSFPDATPSVRPVYHASASNTPGKNAITIRDPLVQAPSTPTPSSQTQAER